MLRYVLTVMGIGGMYRCRCAGICSALMTITLYQFQHGLVSMLKQMTVMDIEFRTLEKQSKSSFLIQKYSQLRQSRPSSGGIEEI